MLAMTATLALRAKLTKMIAVILVAAALILVAASSNLLFAILFLKIAILRLVRRLTMSVFVPADT
jgi:hypothetical protein